MSWTYSWPIDLEQHYLYAFNASLALSSSNAPSALNAKERAGGY